MEINKEAYLSTPRRINTLVMRITSMIAFADQKMKINKLPDKIMFDRLQRIIVEELKKNNSIYPNPLDTLNYLRDLRNYTEFKIKTNLRKRENLNIVRAENINDIISKIAVYNNIKDADKVVLSINKDGATFRYVNSSNRIAEDITVDSKEVDPNEAARNEEAQKIATEIEQKQQAITTKYQDINNQMKSLEEELKTQLATIPSDPNDTPEMIAAKREAIAQPIVEKGKALETQLQEMASDPDLQNFNQKIDELAIQPAIEVANEEVAKEQSIYKPTQVNTSTGLNNQVAEQPVEQPNTIVQQPVAQIDKNQQSNTTNIQNTQQPSNQTV